MQVNRILTYPKKAYTPKFIGLIVRLAIFCSGLYYLFNQVDQHNSFLHQIDDFSVNWSYFAGIQIVLVIGLMPLNWLFEAKKWQLLTKQDGISLLHAMKGVMLGVSMNTFLPMGAGAVAGRILLLDNKQRMGYVPVLVLTQWLQTLVTLLFGSIGITMIIKEVGTTVFVSARGFWVVVGLIAVLLVVVGYILLNKKIAIIGYIKSILIYTKLDWLILLMFSTLRYLVFLVQFVLLAMIFSPELSLQLILGCATWVFVARTIVPRLSNLETLGIRGAAAFYFCLVFNLSFPGVLLTIVALWFINLLIPSLLGFLLLNEVHWQTQKNIN